MAETTITLRKTMRDKIMRLKYALKCDSAEEVIDKMFKVLSKFKMYEELKEV